MSKYTLSECNFLELKLVGKGDTQRHDDGSLPVVTIETDLVRFYSHFRLYRLKFAKYIISKIF
jgi:hypothetical protein